MTATDQEMQSTYTTAYIKNGNADRTVKMNENVAGQLTAHFSKLPFKMPRKQNVINIIVYDNRAQKKKTTNYKRIRKSKTAIRV